MEQSEWQGQIGGIHVLIEVVEEFNALDELLSEPERKDEVAGMVVVHERT
jgi:hypothetical protein